MSWNTISNLITLYSLFHSRFINLYSHQQFEFFRKYRHGNTPHMGSQSFMDFYQLYTLAVWQNLQPPYTPHFVIFQLPGVKSTIDNGRNKGDTWVEVFGWWCFVREVSRFDFDGADQKWVRVRWRWRKRRPDIVSLFAPNERFSGDRVSCVGGFLPYFFVDF